MFDTKKNINLPYLFVVNHLCTVLDHYVFLRKWQVSFYLTLPVFMDIGRVRRTTYNKETKGAQLI